MGRRTDVLKGKFDVNASPSVIISQLKTFRTIISKKWYDDLKDSAKRNLESFMWNDLHAVWKSGPSDVKIYAASTIGCVLLSLGPFYSRRLMAGLMKAIESDTTQSVLLFACFAYLSKFLTASEVADVMSNVKPGRMLGVPEPNNIKILKTVVNHLPREFLVDLCQHYIALYNKNQENVLCLKAAKIVVAVAPKVYIDSISPLLSLFVLGKVFAKNIPVLPKKLAESLQKRCIDAIENCREVAEFEGACTFLRALIDSEQAPRECVHGIYTSETIGNAVSLRAVLILPLEKEVVMKLYGVHDWKEHSLKFNKDVMGATNNDEHGEFDSDLYSSLFIPRSIGETSTFDLDLPLPSLPEDLANDSKAEEEKKEAIPIESVPLPELPGSLLAEPTEVSPLPWNIEGGMSPLAMSSTDNSVPVDSELEEETVWQVRSVRRPGRSPGKSSPMRQRRGTVNKKMSDVGANLPVEGIVPQKPKPGGRRRAGTITKSMSVPTLIKSMEMDNSFVLPPIQQSNNSHRGLKIEEYAGFMTSAAAINVQQLDSSYYEPLMTYFTYYPEYQHELANLILYCVKQEDDVPFLEALKIVSKFMKTLQQETLNCILFQIFNVPNPSPLRRRKILKLIGYICFDRLIKSVGDKMIQFIESSISVKAEKMQRAARNAVVGLYHNSTGKVFRFAFDTIASKLDVFDEHMFENRIGFIADVLSRVSTSCAACFRHLSVQLTEAVSMFTFPRRIMRNIFRVVSVFAKASDDPHDLLIFMRHAVNILAACYESYVGVPMVAKIPGCFHSDLPKPTTNSMSVTDLVENPEAWHTDLMVGGDAAYAFMSSIHWGKMKLKKNEISFIVTLCTKFAHIYPAKANKFAISLINSNLMTPKETEKFVDTSLKCSTSKHEIVSLCELILVVSELQDLGTTDVMRIKLELSTEMQYYRNLSFDEVKILKDFCNRMNVKYLEDQFLDIIMPVEKHNWQSGISPEEEQKKEEIDTDDVEGMEALENELGRGGEYTEEQQSESIDGFAAYLMSITPLVYANLDVPPKYLPSSTILAFSQYSTAQLSERQCGDLLQYSLDTQDLRTLFYVARYAQQMKIKLGLRSLIDHPLIRTRRMFPVVFASIIAWREKWSDLSPEELEYVHLFTTEDMFGFVLNASPSDRRLAERIIRFDTSYFVDRYIEMTDLTVDQLANISIYGQGIPVYNKEFFRLIRHLLSHPETNPIKRLMIYRIVFTYICEHGLGKQQFQCILEALMKTKLENRIPEAELAQKPSAEIIELCYGLRSSKKYRDMVKIQMAQLISVVGKHTPYGSMLSKILRLLPESEIIQYLRSTLPSQQIHVIDYLARESKGTQKIQHSEEVRNALMHTKFVLTSEMHDSLYAYFFVVTGMTDISRSVAKELYYKCKEIFNGKIQIQRLVVLMKHLLVKVSRKGEEISSMMNICVETIESRLIPICMIDFFISLCQRIQNWELQDHVLGCFLKEECGPLAVSVAEALAMSDLMKCQDKTDAIEVVSQCKDFFAMFNAIVSVEKKNRQMGHKRITKCFNGVYKHALRYLTKPKYRIFAPWLALWPSDEPLPENVQDFLVSISDKIQRVHVTDSYHEF